MVKDIGIPVKNAPKEKCEDDPYCPYHGDLKVRGRVFEGTVVSDRMNKAIVIERRFIQLVPKYERYEKKKSKLTAHNPHCINAKIGDRVRVAECRPISKTKKFVVIEKL